MKSTHTYAVLEISPAAFLEIADKLREAGYHHCFVETGECVIDMHGIALAADSPKSTPQTLLDALQALAARYNIVLEVSAVYRPGVYPAGTILKPAREGESPVVTEEDCAVRACEGTPTTDKMTRRVLFGEEPV